MGYVSVNVDVYPITSSHRCGSVLGRFSENFKTSTSNPVNTT